MKYKNRLKKLERRRAGYPASGEGKQHFQAMHKPGSQKK